MRSEDGSIIYRCINGESEAFGLLVDKYKEGIYAFIYAKIGNFHDAEDITQEVFMEAFRNLRKLRRWDSFVIWLYSIAFNLCGKWKRSRSRRPDREFIDDQNSEAIMAITEDTDESDEIVDDESLHKALDSLPETYRQVLTLHYLGGMSSIDIAKSLGLTPTTVRKRLSRAREEMKKEVLAMINATFQQQKLRAGFTFRVVEGIKRIKIHPPGQAKSLPWGLSLAAGIIVAIFSLGSHIKPINLPEFPLGSPLPAESKMLKTGEIPVDVVKIFKMPIISSQQDKGKGGEKLPDTQNAVFLASQGEGGTWTKKADMPTARDALSTSVVNGIIYAIGGFNNGAYLSTIEAYDPETDKWTKKTDMPTARTALSTSVVDGKIYAIGGSIENPWVAISTVEEYDPVKDTWAKKSDMPTKRFALSTCVVNGKIYAIGGVMDPQRGPITSAVEEYDPAMDIWTSKANMPTTRYYLATGSVGGRIYAIGGVDFNGQDWIPFSSVEEYDPALNNWVKKKNMPEARGVFSSSVVNGKIYVIGGAKNLASAFSKVEVYDPVADTWNEGLDMPTARRWLSADTVNGKIYVIGGSAADEIVLTTLEEYTPEGWPFSILPQGKLPTRWGMEKER